MNPITLGCLLIALLYNLNTPQFASASPSPKFITLPGEFPLGKELHLVRVMKLSDLYPATNSEIERTNWTSTTQSTGIGSSDAGQNDTLISQIHKPIQKMDDKNDSSSNSTNPRKDSSENSDNRLWTISWITPNAAVILLFVVFTLIFLVLSFIAFVADRNKRRMNALLRVQNYNSMGHRSLN